MEEKVLIKNERYNVKKLILIILAFGAILSLVLFGIFCKSEFEGYSKKELEVRYENYGENSDYDKKEYEEHQKQGYCYYQGGRKCSTCRDVEEFLKKYPTAKDYIREERNFRWKRFFKYRFLFSLIPLGAVLLISLLIHVWANGFELVITDKKAYGKTTFGKRVDLPIDSISAIGENMGLKMLSLSTASGRIKFYGIKNAAEMKNVLNELIVNRQKANTYTPNSNYSTNSSTNNVDLLRKYKELLDMGAITQEEFDSKKNELLK